MEPTKEQIEELKLVEIEILREFLRICDHLNLRYYLLGGTLLGAVRHQGFIPWDDDIDVGMPRMDFEIFLEKAPKMLPEHLFLQSIWSDPGYLPCFAKIRNNNTTFIETTSAHHKINHGVFIDIFPLDFYPEDKKEQKKFDRKKLLLTHRIQQGYNAPFPGNAKLLILSVASRLRHPSLKKAVIKKEDLYKSTTQSALWGNYGGAWGKKEIVPADWYGEGTEVIFEGMKVMAPVQYDKWLTQVYGDYMQLPPEEKRVGHHYVDIIDLHKSYKEYMEK